MFRRRNNRRFRNAGRRFRNRRAAANYSETHSWTQAQALTTNILRSDIEIQRDRSITLVGYRIQICSMNEPATVQVRVWSPVQQDFVHTSGVRMVPPTGTVITRNFNRVKQITFPRDFPASGKILSVDSLCDRKGEQSNISVIAVLYIRLSPEQLSESCPKTEITLMRLKELNRANTTSESSDIDFVELSMHSPTCSHACGFNSDTCRSSANVT